MTRMTVHYLNYNLMAANLILFCEIDPRRVLHFYFY